MNNHPPTLISIITPSFNQGQFIEETIKSVLNGGHDNFEHIVIDGGSTDETINILKKYKHLIWVSEPDKGQADAINKGFRMAKGDILAWLNSDDCYTPGALKRVADYFQTQSLDFLYSNLIYIDEHSKEIRRETVSPFNLGAELNCANLIPQPTVFMTRKVWETVGPLDVSYHFTMDVEYWMRAGNKFKITLVGDYLAMFREHSTSKTQAQSEKFYREYRKASIKHGGKFWNPLLKYHLRDNSQKFSLDYFKLIWKEWLYYNEQKRS